MRQAQLEDRSLTELRSMAMAMNAEFAFSDDKNKLIKIINDTMAAKVPRPHIPDDVVPSDERLIIRPPRYVSTQAEVMDILQPYIIMGLRVRFPTIDTWMMNFNKREDSGTLRAPLRDIVGCAKRMTK